MEKEKLTKNSGTHWTTMLSGSNVFLTGDAVNRQDNGYSDIH